jgi:3'-5' exoribonuclease 1
MIYIVMDLESTCWKEHTQVKDQEIIEIGAVKLDESLDMTGQYDRFVRPVQNPQLSEFCQALTHITQDDVAHADIFDVVFPGFDSWIGEGSCRIVTWGEYDIEHIRIDCKRHSMKFPKRFANRHVNLKQVFAESKRIRPCGMEQALSMMNMQPQGTHHRAIDDARNLVRIMRVLRGQKWI